MTIKELKKWIIKELHTEETPIYKTHNLNVLKTALNLLEGKEIMGVKIK